MLKYLELLSGNPLDGWCLLLIGVVLPICQMTCMALNQKTACTCGKTKDNGMILDAILYLNPRTQCVKNWLHVFKDFLFSIINLSSAICTFLKEMNKMSTPICCSRFDQQVKI